MRRLGPRVLNIIYVSPTHVIRVDIEFGYYCSGFAVHFEHDTGWLLMDGMALAVGWFEWESVYQQLPRLLYSCLG
jgi:hypothetical protein